MAPRRRTATAVSRFAEDLRTLTQQLNDGVSTLSRATQHKPCVRPSEFREVLSDLQDEVSELQSEVEILEKHTVDAISFEELLGHCLALYQANRSTIGLLEAHLEQYGYQAPPGIVREPENPVLVAPSRLPGKGSGGDADSEDEDDDSLWQDAPTVGGRAGALKATAGKAAAPSIRKQVSLMTPGCVGTAPRSFTARRPNSRQATPASNLGKALADSDDEDGCGGGQADSDDAMDCTDDHGGRGGAGLRHPPAQPARAWEASGLGKPMPTGAMTGKGQALATAQAASWASAFTAAASVRASARKAPRPSVDSRASATPEPMLLSPSVAEMLARYNPPSDAAGSRESMPPTGSTGKASGPAQAQQHTAAAGAYAAQDLAVAMQRLSPFEERGGSRPVAAAAAAAAAQQQQQRGAVPVSRLRTPPSDEDTCSLYHELIRSVDVPSSLVQQPQPQPQAQARPQTARPAAAQAPLPQRSPSPSPMPRQGIPNMELTPPATVGGASAPNRSVTPSSLARANWSEHDKVLAEKFSGLERTWVESGQRDKTPARDLRKSWGGDGAAGGGGLAALARAKSPAPSRAAAEAAAAAASVLGNGGAAAAAVQQPQRRGLVPQLQLGGSPEAEAARVLSPVQEANASPHLTPAGRSARGSRLPAPSAAAAASTAATSTVVGASVTPRRDAAAKEAAAKPTRGTPGRPRTGGVATPGRVPRQQTGSPVHPSTTTPSRANRAITPGRTTRASAAAAGAAAAPAAAPAARGLRGTPAARKSMGEEALELRAAMSAVNAGAHEPAAPAVTPGKASRIASAASAAAAQASAAGPNRTPGRIRVPSAAAAPAPAPFAATSLPQLRIPNNLTECPSQADSWGSESASECGDFQGFPLSRRGADADAVPGGRRLPSPPAPPPLAIEHSDDVILALPPTPTALTPGREAPSAPPAGLGAGGGAAMLAGLSPNTAQLVSRALGESYVGQTRAPPSTTTTSRIPGAAAPRPTAVAAPAAAPTSTRAIPAAPSAPTSLPSSATAVAAAAARALPSDVLDVAPCGEEEWHALPARTQQAFPLSTINASLRTLAGVVCSRPSPDGAPGGFFTVSDVEALSYSTLAAKLLINTLVKLGRAEVVPGPAGGMQYRLRP
ncbi:hypothetical protein HYH03_007508 [Edaphochlamys debaryana]|uniref:Spindle and kinetochore-associated protein 3 n=1 Tax=Edaphochlamys debaryana TaxID=47281 RepID=A0A836BZ65_9CHLO|nr:hypothetical protein HYH03_007508 [Edaphochlamys debaryana]|eukprot:KAG2494456.1 hypothetical protein HYH03_007508 [Edaphochlamys debaryana]